MRIIDHVRGNAVAYLALFVALGGTSAFAAHETIFSDDIVDGQVMNPDLGNDSVSTTKIQTQGVTNADLAPNTVTATRLAPESVETSEIKQGSVFNADLAANSITDTRLAADSVGSSEVKPDSLGGGEIVESNLGKVPDADTLDGTDSSGFIKGKGDIYRGRLVLEMPASTGSSFGDLLSVPGIGDLRLACTNLGSGAAGSGLRFAASSALDAWWFNKDGVGFNEFNGVDGSLVNLVPFATTDPYVVVLQVSAADRVATITATKRTNTFPEPDQCSGSAQATVQID